MANEQLLKHPFADLLRTFMADVCPDIDNYPDKQDVLIQIWAPKIINFLKSK